MSKNIHVIIEQYGKEIDRLSISGNYEKLYMLLQQIKNFVEENEEAKTNAYIYYCLGTGYSAYSRSLASDDMKNSEAMDGKAARIWAISFYRKAIKIHEKHYENESYMGKDENSLLLSLLTNYANELYAIGRPIEALRIYRKALVINPSFSMALGNYGKTLQYLAHMVNDGGHAKVLICCSYQAIRDALNMNDPSMYDGARNAFRKILDCIEMDYPKIQLRGKIKYKKYTLGRKSEKKYRQWCLNNHLFLNPLNDNMQIKTAFAHDPLTITSIYEDVHSNDSIKNNTKEPPRWFAMLNQLKEEYIYARYLCFDGIYLSKRVHFADKQTTLSMASFDYCVYSVRIEQIKTALRVLYSMLDKISFFINDYWDMGIKERDVTAKRIFSSDNYPKDNVLLKSFAEVLREFFVTYGDEDSSLEKDINILRNAMEHKYLKVHSFEWKKKLKIELLRFKLNGMKNLKD